jgi:hypothetical protein
MNMNMSNFHGYYPWGALPAASCPGSQGRPDPRRSMSQYHYHCEINNVPTIRHLATAFFLPNLPKPYSKARNFEQVRCEAFLLSMIS